LAKVPTIQSIRAKGKGGKRLRAEAAAGFYQQGLAHHVDDGTGRLVGLETQMVEWTGDGASPDRVDALAHGVRELLAPAAMKSERQVVTRGRWAGATGRR
jgi:phage terminase large subunit-like protein